MNLHPHAKNQAFSSFCSRDTVNLKIVQSDWPRAFWPISQEPDLSKNTSMGFVQEYRKYHKVSLLTKFKKN